MARVLGCTAGCLIACAFWRVQHLPWPQVYFDDDELQLYQTQFGPYGVSPQQFFSLLHHGKWHVAEPGTNLVRRGDNLNSVMFIVSGSAQAWEERDGERRLVYLYEGKCAGSAEDGQLPKDASGHTRGCIIGGTALIEPDLLGQPYPNAVEVSSRLKYLEWKTVSRTLHDAAHGRRRGCGWSEGTVRGGGERRRGEGAGRGGGESRRLEEAVRGGGERRRCYVLSVAGKGQLGGGGDVVRWSEGSGSSWVSLLPSCGFMGGAWYPAAPGCPSHAVLSRMPRMLTPGC